LQIDSLASFQFVGFMLLVLAVFWSVPARSRWYVALAASWVFYLFVSLAPGQNLLFVPLFFVAIGVAYLIGLRIGAADDDQLRRRWLVAGLLFQLGVLFAFKYVTFTAGIVTGAFNIFGFDLESPVVRWAQPIGVSFFTFMIVSYLIEVFRRHQDPQVDFWRFTLFVSFFPHVMAGPIDRPTAFLPQLERPASFRYQQVSFGLKQILWGFFLKVVIADRLALAANAVFGNPEQYSSGAALFGVYCYALQIYTDFAGYSLIAIGSAKLLGLDLMRNFDRPYTSASIQEFWRRWHISLTTWFRDYLYIPLGGNRRGLWRGEFNVMAVFLISGIWHGAGWTFVVWGLLHGTYLVVGRLTHDARATLRHAVRLDRVPWLQRAIAIFVVFNLVSFAWIFFRATSLTNAFEVIGAIFSTRTSIGPVGFREGDAQIVTLAVMLVILVEVFGRRRWGSALNWLTRRPQWLRWTAYSTVLWAVVLLGVFGGGGFIYNAF
jgi:alginate O-acetyltransferase complex protein AlgI